MRWGNVLFIDGAIWSIGMLHACLSPFQTAVGPPIFLIIVGVQKNLMDIEIVIETHEYLIKIYFHTLLELNLICINFLKNISLTSVVSIFLKYL